MVECKPALRSRARQDELIIDDRPREFAERQPQASRGNPRTNTSPSPSPSPNPIPPARPPGRFAMLHHRPRQPIRELLLRRRVRRRRIDHARDPRLAQTPCDQPRGVVPADPGDIRPPPPEHERRRADLPQPKERGEIAGRAASSHARQTCARNPFPGSSGESS